VNSQIARDFTECHCRDPDRPTLCFRRRYLFLKRKYADLSWSSRSKIQSQN